MRAMASVGGVVALDDEMLVELHVESSEDLATGELLWMVGPLNVAAVVALSRWRDAGAVVTVSGGPQKFLLSSSHARVSVRATASSV